MLEVVYLIFNEGYSATSGGDLTRPALCAEAQRLGRILAGLAPEEPACSHWDGLYRSPHKSEIQERILEALAFRPYR